ncbi:conserved hypothetical protein (plasmid) [Bacillus cereus AH820]|uniref:Uncharacterized protein n=1 Tax=Bacillus cereus (strain AH820) TaxID=405535 RepID=B7JU74_BACC0|nr:conserved hypothetical protein [Bacillus cereus AH820]
MQKDTPTQNHSVGVSFFCLRRKK